MKTAGAGSREGYHQFVQDDGGEDYGSFEVFYVSQDAYQQHNDLEHGWYWWPCFPGCMPDGDPSGPFDSSYEAYCDARGDCP